MAQQLPDVSIVIANWNTRQLLRDCLASVYDDLADGPLSGEVIVVDNGSTDGSAAMVAEQFPQVRLIRNHENRGYAQAGNQGIVEARGRHIMLLNSDTVVRRGTIESMVRYLDAHSGLAGVAPRLLNADGTIQRSCWPFPMKALLANTFSLYRLGILDDYRSWDHADDRQVDWISHAALMIPRRVFDAVGLLDEHFFYGVDFEWAHRAARAGYRFLSLSRGAVVHFGGGSQQNERAGGVTGGVAAHPLFVAVHALYFRKHYGTLGVFVYRLILVAGGLPRLLLWELVHLVRSSQEADRRRVLFRHLVASALKLAD